MHIYRTTNDLFKSSCEHEIFFKLDRIYLKKKTLKIILQDDKNTFLYFYIKYKIMRNFTVYHKSAYSCNYNQYYMHEYVCMDDIVFFAINYLRSIKNNNKVIQYLF